MFALSPIISKRHTKWSTRTEYIENVVIITDGYPWAICHIDTFSSPEYKDIYTRLNNGEVVNITLSIVKDEPSEQDKAEVARVNRAILAGMPNQVSQVN